MSPTRKRYIMKLLGRCIVLIFCGVLCFVSPEEFDILEGMNFFRRPSVLHLLWLIWVVDMVQQIIPLKSKIALGSRKLFAGPYRPAGDKINHEALRNYVITSTRRAYKVFLLWWTLIGIIGVLYYRGVIGKTGLFMISALFFVCDLICVLIWCPFRLMLKNRCCTTCRIFNWDHLMMFSPMIFMGGFYGVSLVLLAIAAWLVWELWVMMYPERFWVGSNAALKCSECTDKLCTQYCEKRRK